MVDRERRELYAETARHFLAGVMTVDDYEERTAAYMFDTYDMGIVEIWYVIWCLYDDFRTERLRDKWALTPEIQRDAARCLLFLYSDCEYRWPLRNEGCLAALLNVLSVGLWSRLNESRRERQLREIGDFAVWPFLNRDEYVAALQKPRFFVRQP
jgi:hypothetical protein